MSGVPGSSAGGTDALCDAHTGQIQGGHCSSAVRGVWRGGAASACRGARCGAWRVQAFWVGLRRGAGLKTLKTKTRVGARLLVAPRVSKRSAHASRVCLHFTARTNLAKARDRAVTGPSLRQPHGPWLPHPRLARVSPGGAPSEGPARRFIYARAGADRAPRAPSFLAPRRASHRTSSDRAHACPPGGGVHASAPLPRRWPC